jgi:myxalamid-type polyketide synthase MxaE and MxaD
LAASTAGGAPVAIIGIGCRFPGGVTDTHSYWRLLCEGVDAIAEIPASRIDLDRYFDPRPATPGRMMTRWGGFLDHIDEFDAEFFGISPREAERMDPQQRLLLETAWEALEDAGLDAHRLGGTRSGVYIGQWLSDFEARLFADPELADFYMTTGSGRYAASGRISYLLGLRGPSLTIDTERAQRRKRDRIRRRRERDPAASHQHRLLAKPHDGRGRSLQVRRCQRRRLRAQRRRGHRRSQDARARLDRW